MVDGTLPPVTSQAEEQAVAVDGTLPPVTSQAEEQQVVEGTLPPVTSQAEEQQVVDGTLPPVTSQAEEQAVAVDGTLPPVTSQAEEQQVVEDTLPPRPRSSRRWHPPSQTKKRAAGGTGLSLPYFQATVDTATVSVEPAGKQVTSYRWKCGTWSRTCEPGAGH